MQEENLSRFRARHLKLELYLYFGNDLIRLIDFLERTFK